MFAIVQARLSRTSVTISGSNFGGSQGSSQVSFNGVPTTASSWNNSQIVAPVPAGATTGIVGVVVNGVSSNGVSFTVLSGPVISGIAPGYGASGAIVTISGTGFGGTQGASTVSFNSITAPALNWSDSQLRVVVPAGATTGPVTVVRDGSSGNSVNFTVLPAPTIASINPNYGTDGQSITIAGSGFGPTQGTSTARFAGLTASVASWSDTTIVVSAPAGVVSGNVDVLIAGIASNGVTFIASPRIASLLPASGAAGISVNIAGRNFGATQGSGTVTFNGTAGTVTSWSNSAIVVTVPNTSSGNVVVSTGTLASNSVSFIVVAAPIVGSVVPTSGAAGTQVTFTGSGFGDIQSDAYVMLGDSYGTVTSWSDTQIQANVSPGAHTGTAQVSRGGALSNAVTFTVITPVVTGTNPNAAARGATVAISGSGFGASQGSGILWLGSTYGIVSSWGDTQIVASVASTSRSGTVKVLQGGVWSVPVGFTVTDSPVNPPIVNISPSMVNLVLGDTFSLQALDSTGAQITGLSWATSDSTIVSLSADDPPILTALATGHVTITTGDGTADVTVYPGPVLPIGTVQWSVTGDGSGVVGIVPAVPSSQGVADVFAIQNSGNVQAVTADGKAAWTTNVGSSSFVADFQGGFVIANQQTVRSVDGMTGQLRPAYSSPSNNSLSTPLVHTDGTIFTIDGGSVVGIDPKTGGSKFSIALEHSITSGSGNCGEFTPYEHDAGPATVGQGIIAGDGYAYFPYVYTEDPLASNVANCQQNAEVFANTYLTHLRMMRVGSDGSANGITIQDWTQTSTVSVLFGGNCPSNGCIMSGTGGAIPNAGPLLGSLITNADQGVLYSWGIDLGPASQVPIQYQLTNITAGSASTVPQSGSNQVQPVLQAQDGSFVGTVSTPAGNFMAAFDQSGNVKWSVAGNYGPSIATADGGVIAMTYVAAVTFDQNGNATGQMANLPTYSWKGAYQFGSVDSIASDLRNIAKSFWASVRGSLAGNGTAVQHPSIGLLWCGAGSRFTGTCQDLGYTDAAFVYLPEQDSGTGATPIDFSADHPNWADLIQTNALGALKAAFLKFPVLVQAGSTHIQNGIAVVDQDRRVYVVGDIRVLGDPAGGTVPGDGRSRVYYQSLMLNAQLPFQNYLPYPPITQQQISQFNTLIPEIGKAIGNVGAHELSHQFQLPDADCTNCANNTYEQQGIALPDFLYIGPPLQWTSTDTVDLTKKLLGSH